MCAVCVAAMATSTTVEDVYAFFNDGRQMGDPIHDPELAIYLLKHGWLMGQAWQVNPEDNELSDKIIDQPDLIHLVLEGIQSTRAYLAVRSRNYAGVGHAVYWDGASVRDPDPSVSDETPLGDYTILSVYPLTWLGHCDLTNRITMPPGRLPFFVSRYRKTGPSPAKRTNKHHDTNPNS